MKDFMMARICVSALRNDLARILRKTEHENYTYVIARHGNPVAALIPMHSFALLQDIEIAAVRERIDTRGQPEPDPTAAALAAEAEAGNPVRYLRLLLRRREARRATRAAQAEAEAVEDRANVRWRR